MNARSFRTTMLLIAAITIAAVSLQAAPSLPITKPPVTPNNLTGPNNDPTSAQGQWFLNGSGVEEYRDHEFHDNIIDHGGGIQQSLAIEGKVASITMDALGNITAFDVDATIRNDTPTSEGQWLDGSNSHGESLSTASNYVGTLYKPKLTAEFAIVDQTTLPTIFPPPYRDRQPYIIADNEDQQAWYCWNEEAQEEQNGNFFVPTWDFADIPVGQSAYRLLKFSVNPPMDSTDSRYTAIVDSLEHGADIFANRTTSLKISTWIDELAIDTGQPYPDEVLRSSDVSVFHNTEGEEELLDWGDAPDQPYPTLQLNNGANHNIVAGAPYFDDASLPGTDQPDPEPNGQQDPNALGDDNDGNDDEDGIVFSPWPLVAGQPGTVTITVAGGAGGGFVDAWIDFNGNGIWEASESIYSAWMPTGSTPVPITVPVGFTGQTFARFRINSVNFGLSPTGNAPDGEVEDHEVLIDEEHQEELDWGDAPDDQTTYFYPTLNASGGANHTIAAGIYMGASIDAESDGQPTTPADGDDLNGLPDDEDGVAFPVVMIPGQNAQFIVTIAPTAPVGYLDVWLDVDQNGDWLGPNDQVLGGFLVNPGPNPIMITLPLNTVPGTSYMRFRYNTVGPLPVNGPAPDGEVEDYMVVIEESGLDWGDAPDGPYPTLAGSIGANHIITTGVELGSLIDTELDGQPDPQALGDDNNNLADEDGIVFVGNIIAGSNGTINVTAGSLGGNLDAWIDFDADGVWAHPGEHLWSGTSQTLGSGTTNLLFSVPGLPAQALGPTFARFRISSVGNLRPDNVGIPTPDGEVEDYMVDLFQPIPTNLVITNLTFLAGNTNAVVEWTVENGIIYQMQANTNLIFSNSWVDVEAQVVGPNNSETNNMASETNKFYRISVPWTP
ncbi:MAG: GEVED domain-containing protein [Verrucomicrobiota bacterium]